MNYYYWKNKLLNKDLGFFSRTKKFKSSSPCSYTKIRGEQDTAYIIWNIIGEVFKKKLSEFEIISKERRHLQQKLKPKVKTKSSKHIKQKLKPQVQNILNKS